MMADANRTGEQTTRWVRESHNLVSAQPHTRCRIVAAPITRFSQVTALLHAIERLTSVRDLQVDELKDGVLQIDVTCVTPRALTVALRAAGYSATITPGSGAVHIALSPD